MLLNVAHLAQTNVSNWKSKLHILSCFSKFFKPWGFDYTFTKHIFNDQNDKFSLKKDMFADVIFKHQFFDEDLNRPLNRV